jgi:proline iminopeptidase
MTPARHDARARTGAAAIAALENTGPILSRPSGTDRPLYPPVEPYAHGWLDVGSGHALYWEQSGHPDGVPVVFLHGGPGAGTAPAYRRFFDPAHYRIILFDQRGAGRSRPTASIECNTTHHLVADLELLRRTLRIERWLVFGGSWGSTLALAYGQEFPERCIAFVLRGVFLFGDDEVDWFLHGMGRIFPEAHRAFVEFLPPAERATLLASYHRRLTDPVPQVHKPAAVAWCAYENACSRLIPAGAAGGKREAAAGRGDSEFHVTGSLAMARIESHYMMNRGFLAPNQLLDGVRVLAGHPAVIVQGRYDMVCPIATADRLARAWPGAQYRVVPDAGHSSMEPGIRSALVKATDDFKIYG